MINESICGTYWAVRLTLDGKIPKDPSEKTCLWICQGDKPVSTGISYQLSPGFTMLWLDLVPDAHTLDLNGLKVFNSNDFLDLNFPDISVEDGLVEIYISKSGKVYLLE